MVMKKITLKEIVIIFSAISLCLLGIIFLDKIYTTNIGGLSQEIFSAVLASVFTIAAMTVVMNLQSRQEKEKEFSSKLFEKKLEIYQDLLKLIFSSDDDNILENSEIQEIENKIGEASIVASSKLVSSFSQFMIQLKVYGCLYRRSMTKEQQRHFVMYFTNNPQFISEIKRRKTKINIDNFDSFFITIDDLLQGIREDLNVVEGDIKMSLSHFLFLKIDNESMIKNPNLID